MPSPAALPLRPAISCSSIAPAWWLAPVATIAIGLGFYMLHNTLQTNATQMTPQARGTAVAIFSSAIFVGQTVGVATGALVIDRLGAVPLFLGAAAALPVLAIWFARQSRRHRRGPDEKQFSRRHLFLDTVLCKYRLISAGGEHAAPFRMGR